MAGDYPYSEVRDGMAITWDVPIEMDDGLVLRADVYRPIEAGAYPVIMSYGIYGKWLHFESIYEDAWERMCADHPDVPEGSTNNYQAWEVVDPEKWVPDGYVVVRVDSRGAGRSPGYVDPHSARETRDFAACIEWAGERDWSNGKVGLSGISYYAINQWQVAAERPDHLAAICVWEGVADRYRDGTHHGGIYTNYVGGWAERQAKPVQHGRGENGYRSTMTGDWVSGPETLTDEELGANMTDMDYDRYSNKLIDGAFWEARIPDLSKIDVPVLSAGNWGGHGLHLRGNLEGFARAGTDQKWLEVHGGEHWAEFYTDYGVGLQKRFFGHFLRGEDSGWEDQPRVQLNVRHPGETFELRHEDEWPIARTDWQRYYLDAGTHRLAPEPATEAAAVEYDPLGDGVTFLAEPFDAETELTGPMAATLYVASATEDADLFLVVRLFRPDMKEVTFQGALDPHKPIALGWLRASHRQLDAAESEPWRPYHPHDDVQPLEPGEIVELEVEIWPTCIVAPAGFRLGLSVRGRDYEYPGDVGGGDLGNIEGAMTGVGFNRHTDARDRPPAVYGGDVTLYTGPAHPSSVLLPIVPEAA